MSMPGVDGGMAILSIIGKASVLLAAAAMVHALLRRRMSAAARHLLWALTVVGLLLLPMLAAVLPGWTVARVTSRTLSVGAPMAEPEESVSSILTASDARVRPSADVPATATWTARIAQTLPWSTVLPALYAAGVLFLLVRLIGEHAAIHRLARRATDVSDQGLSRLLLDCAERIGVRRPVRLLRAPEHTMPMAFGTRRPAIVIPAVADTWTADRRRAVLLHELAHVSRYDCLTQEMAAVACALYWIHPGIWWIARRLRVERELACDDRVLALGTQAHDYAGHLLELAYSLSRHHAPALAVSMARPRQLEGRMLAALDAARNRATPALRSQLAGLAVTAALIVPLAAANARLVEPDSVRLGASQPAGVDSTPQPSSNDPAQRTEDPRPSAQPSLPGTWEIRPTREAGTVQLRLNDGYGSYGAVIRVERLEGLLPAQLSDAGGPVRFSIRRDAGTFTFEGTIRSGVGAGTYTFAPSSTFPAELAKRGIGQPTPADQYTLARDDVGFAFLDELAAQGYQRPNLAQLLRAAQHGVGLDYLREMGRLLYRLGFLEALINQRNHGVSPEFIRELAAEGLTGLTPDDLIRARNNGVSPEYVRDLSALGYRRLSLDELVRLRNNGVSPEYVRDLDALGYRNLPRDELVRLRNNGVSPEYVRELRALGYQNLSLDTLVRLRNHGVSPEYVHELKDLGYERLDIEDLVMLREYGVTPDRVRSANARAGRRLTVDMLKAAAANGWR
jgi:beta-lactamase regulating signal transducer with metallopeptidase domain